MALQVNDECSHRLNQLFSRADFFTKSQEFGDYKRFLVDDHASRPAPNHFTGLTLGELYDIISEGHWICGKHTTPSASSPLALWGCTTPGMALDRAGISRGYASNHGFVPNGWDCPVVLAAHRPELTNHGDEFHNGSRKVLQS